MERDAMGCVSLDEADLAVLGDLRREPGVRVALAGGRAWVWWESRGEAILRRTLPLPGAVAYECRAGLWYRQGCRLPTFGLPVDPEAGQPLYRVLVPEAVRALALPAQTVPKAVTLVLTPDDRPRPATALRCRLDVLGRWVESAATTTAAIEALRGAIAEDEVMVLGRRPPPLAGSVRYWGEDVLAPLGFRPEPGLPGPALRGALGVADSELLVLSAAGCEAIDRDAFQPLSRAGVRRTWEGRSS